MLYMLYMLYLLIYSPEQLAGLRVPDVDVAILAARDHTAAVSAQLHTGHPPAADM